MIWFLIIPKFGPLSFLLISSCACIVCYTFILFLFTLGLRRHWAVAVQVLGTSLVQQRGCNRNLKLSLSGKKLCHASCGITNFQMKRSISYPNKTNWISWYLAANFDASVIVLRRILWVYLFMILCVFLFCWLLKDKCASGRRDRW